MYRYTFNSGQVLDTNELIPDDQLNQLLDDFGDVRIVKSPLSLTEQFLKDQGIQREDDS